MNMVDDSLKIESRANPYRQDEDDKVLVLLDVRNVCSRQGSDYSNSRIDYGKQLEDVIGKRKCVAAIAIDGVQHDERGRDVSRIFHEELRMSGYRLELVPASNNKGKQEGADIKIALIALRYALEKKCDVVELITGDGDFTVLVQELHTCGVLVSVTAFHRSLSYSLKDSADQVKILDEMPIVRMSSPAAEVA